MYIAIGKIIQTHGIQGYLKVIAYSGYPDRFLKLKTAYIEIDREMRGFIIDDIKSQNQATLIKFRGIDNREAARFLVKNELWVPEDQKIDLPEDNQYANDQ